MPLTISRVSVLLLLPCVGAQAFTFRGLSETSMDRVVHAQGYSGGGGVVTIDVGIKLGTLNANSIVTSVENVVNTYNQRVATTGNLVTSGGAGMPLGAYDFESTALHEMGHSLGLSHPNAGSESMVFGSDRNYTKAGDGADNSYDFNPGVDGVIGSHDDIRGDDQNFNYFKIIDNDPFTLSGGVIDATTYSRDLADLPTGDLFSTNGDRAVAGLSRYGQANTESVMQQGQYFNEAQRTLSADDVAGLRYAMAGLDELAGTADDYVLKLNYVGITSSADILFDFDNFSSFATSSATMTGIGTGGVNGGTHLRIVDTEIHFNTQKHWFYNQESNAQGSIWDLNGSAPGAGGAAPSGDWSGWNWSTENSDSAGGGNLATSKWDNRESGSGSPLGNVAAFSAGNDATGSFTVNADVAGVVLTGVSVEQGQVTIAAAGGSLALNEAPTGNNALGYGQGGANHAEFNIASGAKLIMGQALTDDSTAGDGLLKTGTGLLEIASASTYTGETLVAAGEFRVRSGGSTTSNTTVQGGATFSGAGTVSGDLTIQAGGAFRPGDGGMGNLVVTGGGNVVSFDDNAELHFQLDTGPSSTKAGATSGGDHLSIGAGSSLQFDGNLHVSDLMGVVETGFYELVSVEVAQETLSFANDMTDFAAVPDQGLGYRIESGSVDLVIADAPNPEINNAVIDFGTLIVGNSSNTFSYDITNAFGADNVLFDASNLSLIGATGDVGDFNHGFSPIALLAGGATHSFAAQFLGSLALGQKSAFYTFSWDDIMGDALRHTAASATGHQNGVGDYGWSGSGFFLPEDMLAGTLELELRAFVKVAPEPSRALLLLIGLCAMLLRRTRE